MGLAFAGPVVAATTGGVTIGNGFTVVNSAGTPTVQIVVGSHSAPSDGVVAANIAAVIGNLAFASTPITATVNGLGAVTCVVTTPSCTLSNQQVWLGVRGTVAPTGSILVKALIGSVLNSAVLNYNTVQNTKGPLSTSSQYTYPEGTSPYPITSTPNPTSAWAGLGPISAPVGALASTNGGGAQFTSFTASGGLDNVLELSHTQIPALITNQGTYSESEYLWIMGFPVFDQQTNVSNFQLLSGNGAVQIVFGKPIRLYTSHANFLTSSFNHAQFTLLGENWTVFNATMPAGVSAPDQNHFVIGGNLTLAESQVPLTLLYVGQNITAGPLVVALQDLTYPNASGGSKAVIGVYKNGVETNETTIAPGTTQIINATGTTAYIYVQTTTPGLYATQRWAKIQVFSNIFNLTNGNEFGTSNPLWLTELRWTTNQTSPTGTMQANAQNAALQGIVIYSNLSKSWNIVPGQTISFIQNPLQFNLTFVGDTLGTPSATNSYFDAQTVTTGSGTFTYSNPLTTPDVASTVFFQTFSSAGVVSNTGVSNTVNVSFITEPTSLLTLTSSNPSGFQLSATSNFAGALSQPATAVGKVTYNLGTYELATANVLDPAGGANALAAPNGGLLVTLAPGSAVLAANYIDNNNPLTITVTGYKYGNGGSTTLQTVSLPTFNALTQNQVLAGVVFKNVTNIQVNNPLVWPGVVVTAYDAYNVLATNTNTVPLGTLMMTSPSLLYVTSPYTNNLAPNALSASVVYLPLSSTSNYYLTQTMPTSTPNGRFQYFTLQIPQLANPIDTSGQDSNVLLGVTNQSTVGPAPLYWLNQTGGSNGKVEYNDYQKASNPISVLPGFRTERGSEVGPITTTSFTFYEASQIDLLNFEVGPVSQGAIGTVSVVGPFSIGQSYQNITIENVSATCGGGTGGASCKVNGLSNVTATPSATKAISPVALNTAATPIAVLDSQASSTQNLIVVGSKFVNSVAASIFSANPTLASSFAPGSVVVQQFGNQYLVAGWTANQTVTAGNQFIAQLLAAAGE